MNNHKLNALGGSIAFLLLGACSGPVAPAKPTWEADIYPIVQGQCLNCHGATANETGLGFRFDLFDLEKCDGLPPPPAPLSAPNGWGLKAAIADDVKPQPRTNDNERVVATFRPRMPPAPASLLEDWQVETIANWAKISNKEDARGARPTSRNRRPTIQITSELPEKAGSELTVSFVVEDGDNDSVIGVLKIGDQSHYINSAGSGEHTFDLSGESNGELTLSADLCDGWGKRTVEIKKVEKE